MVIDRNRSCSDWNANRTKLSFTNLCIKMVDSTPESLGFAIKFLIEIFDITPEGFELVIDPLIEFFDINSHLSNIISKSIIKMPDIGTNIFLVHGAFLLYY